MFLYPWDIFPFHSFGCPLGSQLGSLLQKCAPDRRAQNSLKGRLCFLPIRHFSICVPLVVPWGPNLDPCCASVILTGARNIHTKVVYVSFTHQTFSISIPLAAPWASSWILVGKIRSWQELSKCDKNPIRFCLAAIHFQCSFLWVAFGIPSWMEGSAMRTRCLKEKPWSKEFHDI